MTGRRQVPLLPGSVIGIVGGGQLGRMTAMAARSLGYRVHGLDPSADAPMRVLCDRFIQAGLDDPLAAESLSQDVDVLTCEREDVGPRSLHVLQATGRLRPGASVLETVQDRARQKDWLQARGFPVGPYRPVSTVFDMAGALAAMGPAPRLKRCRGGFDGRAQWRAESDDADTVWTQVGRAPVVVERELPLRAELSVLVARSAVGEAMTYPVAQNNHRRGALHTSVIPAMLPAAIVDHARRTSEDIANRLGVVGLLTVEWFWTADGELFVNELAPRPHNSFHATEWACATSQFEQLVRAVCGLPLGDATVRSPTALANLYGDLWLSGKGDRLLSVLAAERCHLRLYDKAPRPSRKLGHIACTADSPQRALAAIDHQLEMLTGAQPPVAASHPIPNATTALSETP